MWTSRIEKLLRRLTILLAGVIALIAAASTNSEAGARSVVLKKASTMQQERPIKLRYYGMQQEEPIKLRYYGGPKSSMYAE